MKNDNGKAQLRAYAKRDQIKVGDKFLWHFHGHYATSGKLPKDYMAVSDKWGLGDIALTVVKVYEGRNGWGDFVDYWLSTEMRENPRPIDCLIINGPDAFKMGRAG